MLLGDIEQLQAIEAGAPFRGILTTVGAANLEEVRRQRELWQRTATRQLSTGATAQALAAYAEKGLIRENSTVESARTAMLASWAASVAKGASVLMLAHTRKGVRELNELARELRKGRGELPGGVTVETERGQREMAVGERIYFLRNEKGLGVKNGTLAEVLALEKDQIAVRILGPEEREVRFDPRAYRHIDYGYAATIHKTQGATVDRTVVLATPGLDRHLTYVALSRHRDSSDLHYAREQFSSRDALVDVLSRARPKDMASDYFGRDAELPVREREPRKQSFKELIDAAAERTRTQRGSRESDPNLEIAVVSREVVAAMAEQQKAAKEQEAARQREVEAQQERELKKQRGMDRGR